MVSDMTQPTVTLEPMPPARISEWSERLWVAYRNDIVKAGSSEAEADANVARNREALMPGGQPAPGQHIFDVTLDGAVVGALWLAEHAPGDWFVYDIEIHDTHRGRGLGRASMLAAEDYVRAHGGTKLGLSVFGFNEVAQNLYRSLDYQVLAMNMVKELR
jgi:ribosomal protein S18 acetylase RimI-like enzyme